MEPTHPKYPARVLAWAWHPSSADDYEVWLFREPVNKDGFRLPGIDASRAQLTVTWADYADTVADLDGFYQWVFAHSDATLLQEHGVAVETVQSSRPGRVSARRGASSRALRQPEDRTGHLGTYSGSVHPLRRHSPARPG
jgi:hypothetical protein